MWRCLHCVARIDNSSDRLVRPMSLVGRKQYFNPFTSSPVPKKNEGCICLLSQPAPMLNTGTKKCSFKFCSKALSIHAYTIRKTNDSSRNHFLLQCTHATNIFIVFEYHFQHQATCSVSMSTKSLLYILLDANNE